MKKLLWKLLPGFAKRAIIKRVLVRALNQNKALIKEVQEMELVKAIFTSKKVAAFILGVLAIALRELAGLDDATVDMIIELVKTYLFAQAGVDAILAFKGAKKK